jgi:uncharacterized protein (DUF433 family)
MVTKEHMATKQTEVVGIEKTEGVCGGTACVAGTRVPVWSIVETWRRGVSEKELQTYFVRPLSGADVKAALEYFEEHPQEIEEEIRRNAEA